MKLLDIISISGKSGLFKLISSKRMPFTVEDLTTGRKLPVFPRDKVTALSDISIYTYDGDMPLGEVFQAIHDQYPENALDEKEVTQDAKSMATFMEKVLPNYDKERVQESDIKKLVKWYCILTHAGMESFVEAEEEEQKEE